MTERKPGLYDAVYSTLLSVDEFEIPTELRKFAEVLLEAKRRHSDCTNGPYQGDDGLATWVQYVACSDKAVNPARRILAGLAEMEQPPEELRNVSSVLGLCRVQLDSVYNTVMAQFDPAPVGGRDQSAQNQRDSAKQGAWGLNLKRKLESERPLILSWARALEALAAKLEAVLRRHLDKLAS